ncbi:MAG: ATP-NAD kinase family protein [Salinirussus sp.]
MKRVGVVVNPIAGLGGQVGLKGTDNKVAEARERGAEPRAPDRAREALAALHESAPGTEIITADGIMGAEAAKAAGFDPVIVTHPPTSIGDTSADDTKAAVRAFLDHDVDLILFVGGDGTAVDVAETIAAADTQTPILGVPAGVKIYSAVFAVTPRAAGRVAGTFERTEQAEVNDVDEEAYRDGAVRTQLRALARVPVAEERQASKQLSGGSIEGLASAVAEDLRPGVTYIFGPGSTTGAIATAAGFEASPLGVDVWRDGEVLVRDGAADDIRGALGAENVIIVSPIGGQGFVFGRGNQQLAPDIIRASEIEIVASRRKLDGLGVLRVDTGDHDLDDSLRGWWKVRVGRAERRLIEIV